MKQIVVSTMAAVLVSAQTAPAQETPAAEATVRIPFGTIVMGTFDQGLTTIAKARKAEEKGYRQVKAGDTVTARVTDDVKLDGKTVIAAGAPLTLRVGSQTTKNRRMGRKGLLALEAVMVQAVDGTAVPLQGQIDSEGRGRVGSTVALTYAFGPLGLLKKGKPAELPAGGIYQTMVAGQVEITITD